MIKFIGSLPEKCTVAFSGGVDSVAIADFLVRGGRHVHLAFFHHGTDASSKSEEFVKDFAKGRGLSLSIGRLVRERPPRTSQEEFWRDERYHFLKIYDWPVITAHHLDDAVETWVFNSLHGNPRLIPYRRGNVLRPFLITRKDALRDWCVGKGLSWIEDESNNDTRFMRNYVRHELLPKAYHVNPGLHTVVLKKYLASGEDSSRSV